MTEEEYNKKYNSKSIKQLCNTWRREYIKIFKKYNDEWTINNIKKIEDEDIIKFGLSKIIEEIYDDKKEVSQ